MRRTAPGSKAPPAAERPIRWAAKRTMSQSAEFKERGGARINFAWNWTWPFATLRATSSSIEVRIPGRRYTVSRDQVQSLRIGRVLFSMGLEIDHSESGVPPLIFWTWNAARLEANLKSLGYLVAREKLTVGV